MSGDGEAFLLRFIEVAELAIKHNSFLFT